MDGRPGVRGMPKLSLISKSVSLCAVTRDYKSTVKYTAVSCGDSWFSLWVDVAIGSASAHLRVEILSRVAAYLELWHVHGQKHVTKQRGELLPTVCSKRSWFQINWRVYVWKGKTHSCQSEAYRTWFIVLPLFFIYLSFPSCWVNEINELLAWQCPA